jgi:hypothetical protein
MAKPAPLAISIAIASLLVGSIAGVFGRDLAQRIGRAVWGESASDVLHRDWSTYTVAGLTISSPSAFTPFAIDLAPQDQQVMATGIERFDTFRSEAGPVEVTLTMMLFRPGVIGSLQAAAAESAARLSRAFGVTDFRHANTQVDIEGYPAIRTSASFVLNARNMQMESLVVMTPRAAWQVQTLFVALGPARQIAERVLSSVAF